MFSAYIFLNVKYICDLCNDALNPYNLNVCVHLNECVCVCVCVCVHLNECECVCVCVYIHII